MEKGIIIKAFRVALFDLKARYHSSFFGYLWTFISPLTVLIVISLVFGQIIKIQIENFPVFVMVAYIPWTFYTSCVHNSAYCYQKRKAFIKNFQLSPLIFPLSVAFSGLIHFLLSIPIILIALAVFNINLSIHILWLPIIIVFQLIFLIGISFMISAVSFFIKDIQEMIALFVLVHFYITPIFYSADLIGRDYKDFYFMNPMACFVELYRF
ncbi:ABC transporter permease, partial [bacterium]|nr:ABC transporter permease [bacterium]